MNALFRVREVGRAHNTEQLLVRFMFLYATLHVASRAGVCIHQPTPDLWSMKEAPQKTAAAWHSDKSLQIITIIKNLSCLYTIDSKKRRENRQSETLMHPAVLLHTDTDILPLIFYPWWSNCTTKTHCASHASVWV